jgi:hypothetical protein
MTSAGDVAERPAKWRTTSDDGQRARRDSNPQPSDPYPADRQRRKDPCFQGFVRFQATSRTLRRAGLPSIAAVTSNSTRAQVFGTAPSRVSRVVPFNRYRKFSPIPSLSRHGVLVGRLQHGREPA